MLIVFVILMPGQVLMPIESYEALGRVTLPPSLLTFSFVSSLSSNINFNHSMTVSAYKHGK